MKKTLLKMATVLLTALFITSFQTESVLAKPVSVICMKSGCQNSSVGGSWYCYKHQGSGYSSKHTAKKEVPCYVTGCTRKKQSSSSYCDYHYNQRVGNKKKNSYTGSSNKNSSKKKSYSMPDPDDYEDFDDFMDDWDGCMPDGSDAEDYYDNW